MSSIIVGVYFGVKFFSRDHDVVISDIDFYFAFIALGTFQLSQGST
jgi:hypothetical protein